MNGAPGPRPPALFVLGAAIGAWGTACGVGGGLFAVPLLHYVLRCPLRVSVATSLVLVAASTSAATAAELVHADAALHVPTLALLLAGSVLGTGLGMPLARRIGTRFLKAIFVVVLSAVALKLLLAPPPVAGGPLGAFDDLGLGAREHAWIALVGLVSGLMVPLLGVGGGLVAVPALYLGLPPLGYLGARATSMAMSMGNAWLSVWLHRNEDVVRWDVARPFAAGGLAGAVLGVWSVHHPGLDAIARGLLAVTLGFAALRFGWDLRARPGGAQA